MRRALGGAARPHCARAPGTAPLLYYSRARRPPYPRSLPPLRGAFQFRVIYIDAFPTFFSLIWRAVQASELRE